MMKRLTPALPDSITVCDQADIAQAADITADAFENDPFNSWLFKSPRHMGRTFHLLAKHIYEPHGICHRIKDEAATMWMMSDTVKETPLTLTLQLAWAMTGGTDYAALKRGLATDEAMRRQKPEIPHLYLFTIGARQRAQGKAYGRQLMMPMLQAADAAGLPTYLENSNPENRGFYGSFGFQRLSLFSPLEGSPPLEAMWRAPKTA